MSDEQPRRSTVEPLILDLLEWIGGGRLDAEVMDAWRTSCPRLPVWEEACELGLIEQRSEPTCGTIVSVSALGVRYLREHR